MSVKLECAECGAKFTADRTRGAGPSAAFETEWVYFRAFFGDVPVGCVRLDRAAADKGGTLEERLAACDLSTPGHAQRGRCLACLAAIAVRFLNDSELNAGDNTDEAVEARVKALHPRDRKMSS